MALTRRIFHAHLLTAALAAALAPVLPRVGRAGGNAQPAPADQFLNRLSFGANAASRAAVAALGPQGWLDQQLALPPSDPALAARLARARLRLTYPAGDDGQGHSWPAKDAALPLAALSANPATAVPLLDFTNPVDYAERIRPAQEVIAASLIRAVHAPAQLREVVTQFWHDHFNVNALKSETTAAFFPGYDAMLRDNAFGNFRVMLGQVARAPAMLYYLNNDDSRASPANENFARELLELHTLGVENYRNDTSPNWHAVPGAAAGLALAYIDQDVYEVARAFTGWSVGDGRMISDGVAAPKTGLFHYVEAWHDPYQKRILAVEFAPNAAPMHDGDRVLDMLATHPGTAAHIARKLIRRLLADDPDPGMVARIAAVFLAHANSPGQIAQTIRAIVAEPAFTGQPPQKLRRPFEYLAALYRATGAQVNAPEASFAWFLAQAGWFQHEYGPPTGHPDRADRWTSAATLGRMVDLALYAHDDWFACTDSQIAALLPPGPVSFDVLTQTFLPLLLGTSDDPLEAFANQLGITDRAEPFDLTAEERHGFAAAAVAFAALTPQFMLR